MPFSSAVSLDDVDKLTALQRLDQFRKWRSLDDKRYCLVCGKIITGRQIQVADDIRGDGSQRLNCPTERCNSIPMDWALPTDEILAAAEMAACEQREIAFPKAAEQGITSQLPRLAGQFEEAV
jgi:hypothetical protein